MSKTFEILNFGHWDLIYFILKKKYDSIIPSYANSVWDTTLIAAAFLGFTPSGFAHLLNVVYRLKHHI